MLVELGDAVVGIGQATFFVEVKGAAQVFGITLASLAQDVGEVAPSQVIAPFNGLLIPINGSVDISSIAYTEYAPITIIRKASPGRSYLPEAALRDGCARRCEGV